MKLKLLIAKIIDSNSKRINNETREPNEPNCCALCCAHCCALGEGTTFAIDRW